MSELLLAPDTEPTPRGTVTRIAKPAPVPSDVPLQDGTAMLRRAAETAWKDHAAKIAEVQKSLAPVVKESASLLKTIEDLYAKHGRRLEELVAAARSRDLRRYAGIDRALEGIDRAANEALRQMASGLRVLPTVPKRVRDLTWVEVQTLKYEDIRRDVACFRDGPAYIRGCVEDAERILKEIEEKVKKSSPTRQFLEEVDDSPRPSLQTKADASWDPFKSRPERG